MTRISAIIVALVLLSGCKKTCEDAVKNQAKVAKADLTGEEFQKAVSGCKKVSSQASIDCITKARTDDDLNKCTEMLMKDVEAAMDKARKEFAKKSPEELLTSFKTYVTKNYPGTPWKADDLEFSCSLTSDVMKSDSISSPYVGTLVGSMVATSSGGQHKTVNLVFTLDSAVIDGEIVGSWKCDDSLSKSVDDEGKAQSGPCSDVEFNCRGKAR